MTAVVRELRPVENEPDADTMSALEGFLADARKGELVGVAIVAHRRGGEIATQIEMAPNGGRAHIVAALEKLKMRILFPKDR